MRSLGIVCLCLMAALKSFGSENFLQSFDDGQVYTLSEVNQDRKNHIPLMRDSMCFFGNYSVALAALESWGQRQFADIRVKGKSSEQKIELAHFYTQCVEEDMSEEVEWGEPRRCLRYSDPIYTGSKFVKKCQ